MRTLLFQAAAAAGTFTIGWLVGWLAGSLAGPLLLRALDARAVLKI